MVDFILGAICFVIFILLFWFGMDAIAKLGNVNFQRRGISVASPDAFDEDLELIKRTKDKTINAFKFAVNSFKRPDNNNLNRASDKIRLLKELEELRLNGNITDPEYINLKDEILK